MARQPITWQNVNAPNLRDTAIFQGSAARHFEKAFDGARDINTIFGDHHERHLDANTAAFTNELMRRYQTPEEFEAARQSGEIDAFRAQYGDRLRADETGAGLINRLAQEAQQRQIGKMNYQNLQQEQAAQPILSQLTGYLHKGDNSGAGKLIEESINNGTLTGRWASNARSVYDQEIAKDREAQQQQFNNNMARALAQKDHQAALRIANNPANALGGEHFLQAKQLETDNYVSGLSSKLYGQKSDNKDRLRDIVTIENSIEKLTGFTMQELNSNPALVNNLPVQKRLQAIQQIEQLNTLHASNTLPNRRQSIAQLASQIQKEQGVSELDANIMAETVYNNAAQFNAPSQAQQAQLQTQLDDLAEAYKHVPLVKDNLASVANPMQAVLDDKAMDKVSKMTADERREVDSYLQILNRGYIPAGFNGNNEKRPLTLTEAKYIFKTTDDDTGWKDFFSTSVRDRINEMLEKPAIPAEQIREYDEYLRKVEAAKSYFNFENDPAKELSNFRLNNVNDELVNNMFSMVREPSQETPEQFNRRITPVTDETSRVDMAGIENRIATLTQRAEQAQLEGNYAKANQLNQQLGPHIDVANAAQKIQKLEQNILRWQKLRDGDTESRGRNRAMSDTQLDKSIAKATKEIADAERQLKEAEQALMKSVQQ